jgi:hypothetical protein
VRGRKANELERSRRSVLARTDQILEKYLMFILQDLDDADIESAKEGLKLIGRAAQASFQRVHSDGIVPGRLSSRLAPSERRKIEPI